MKINKYLLKEDEEEKAFKEMTTWLKNIKSKISKAESSIKKRKIDSNVVDVMMRMSKVDEESFFEYFWR